MRNLLEEFHSDHGLRPPTILGVREHVFTGRYVQLKSSDSVLWNFGFTGFISNICYCMQCLIFSFIYVQSRN